MMVDSANPDLTCSNIFQGKESFEQEETKKAAKSQIKSENKNKGKIDNPSLSAVRFIATHLLPHSVTKVIWFKRHFLVAFPYSHLNF